MSYISGSYSPRGRDFDDLLFYAVKSCARTKKSAAYVCRIQVSYVMIDEYQDTITPKYMLAKLLTASHKNLFAVGDEDQSIYGWRGATIDNILNFAKTTRGLSYNSSEQNYRSTQTIPQAASDVVANNQMRKGKTLYSVATKASR